MCKVTLFFSVLSCALCLGLAGTAAADNFADAVEAYVPAIVNGEPTPPYREPTNALGAPDYIGANVCPDGPSCTFVSLGSGGSITVEFVDNALTGSDDNAPDLWIYEIGPDVEDTFVEISADNIIYISVGTVLGATSTIDIDAFGYGATDQFTFVRLTDDATEGAQTGATVGADIDAVEAISSTPIAVLPTTWAAVKAQYR